MTDAERESLPPAGPPAPPRDDGPEVKPPDPTQAEDGDELSPSEHAKRVGEKVRAAVEREPEPEPEPEPAHPLAGLGATPILPDEAEKVGLAVCPICEGWGGVDPDAALAALDRIVEAVAPFPQSSVFECCDECNGWGRVLTGARRAEPGIQPCPVCDGRGYRDRREAAAAVGPPALQVAAPGAYDYGQAPDPMRRSPADGATPPAVGMVWDEAQRRWTYPQAS